MAITPLGSRVLVKRAAAKTTKGGILLPQSAQEKPKEGEVIAIGPGKIDKEGNLQAMQIRIGDRILFGAYAGTEVKKDTEHEYLILSEEEIIGILE
jgi:chaperonin GroES